MSTLWGPVPKPCSPKPVEEQDYTCLCVGGGFSPKDSVSSADNFQEDNTFGFYLLGSPTQIWSLSGKLAFSTLANILSIYFKFKRKKCPRMFRKCNSIFPSMGSKPETFWFYILHWQLLATEKEPEAAVKGEAGESQGAYEPQLGFPAVSFRGQHCVWPLWSIALWYPALRRDSSKDMMSEWTNGWINKKQMNQWVNEEQKMSEWVCTYTVHAEGRWSLLVPSLLQGSELKPRPLSWPPCLHLQTYSDHSSLDDLSWLSC